jgi:hypothetical protein
MVFLAQQYDHLSVALNVFSVPPQRKFLNMILICPMALVKPPFQIVVKYYNEDVRT